MDLLSLYVSRSDEAVLVGVVTWTGHDVNPPIIEDTQFIAQQQCQEPLRGMVPVEVFEEPWESSVPEVAVPQIVECLAVVVIVGADTVFLGPQVNHFLGGIAQWIGEEAGECDRESCRNAGQQPARNIRDSPHNRKLVNRPVEGKEVSKRCEEVPTEEWIGIFEEVVGTLLKRNSCKCSEITRVALLKVRWEGLIGIEGILGHFNCN